MTILKLPSLNTHPPLGEEKKPGRDGDCRIWFEHLDFTSAGVRLRTRRACFYNLSYVYDKEVTFTIL